MSRGSHPNSRANLVSPTNNLGTILDRTVAGPNGCVIWTGKVHKRGYAQTRVAGVAWKIHRYVYSQMVGPIPTGLTLDHLCEVKRCVNPAHLEPVTNRENVQRYYRRGDRRIRRGESK